MVALSARSPTIAATGSPGREIEQHEGDGEHAEERGHEQHQAERDVADHGRDRSPSVQRCPVKTSG